ncbi:MAG: porin [Gemmatimonadota bacterium]|nr:porin [Gemmatimonadota bacterium]
MRLVRLNGAFLLLTVAVTAPALAQQDTTPPSPAALEQRLEELDQRIRVLDRKRELAADSAAAAAKTRASVTAGSGGFSFTSADKNFQIRFKGYVQFDGRFFHDDQAPLVDNFLIRRARPVFEATLYKYIDFRVMPDFAGTAFTLFDAFGEVKVRPELNLRAGKFKPPVGLERLQSATDYRFIERGLPTNLAPNRDIGAQVAGDLGLGVLSYAVGIFNGVPDLGNGDAELSDRKDVAGRIFFVPFAKQGAQAAWEIGIGIAGSTGREEGLPATPGLAGYRSPGQVTVFKYRSSSTTPLTGTVYANGPRRRIAPQGYINYGPLSLLGEYTISRQVVSRDTGATRTSITLEHEAWQAVGSFYLTGERASFKSITPKKNFDPANHTWGALEVVARYGQLDFDDAAFTGNRYADSAASVTKEKSLGLGLTWHLDKNIKISFNYDKTSFDGGTATGDRRDEKFISTRFQTAF